MLPKTMRAAVLVAQNQPLELAEIKLPDHLDVGQVLVELHYSGICGSQIGEIDGAKGEDRFLPHLLGHEGSGVVMDVGPGVRHVSKGDHVVLHWRKGRGIEGEVPKYSWNGKQVNAGWVTTFNQYAVVSENRVTAIPEDSDMRVAALFGCAVTTGFGVVTNNAGVRIGESVVVMGAGGIGLNIVQAAAMTSAWPVIAVDLVPGKLELARRMGATHTINGNKEDVASRIRKILENQTLDVFIDNTGESSLIEMGYKMTGSAGRLVLVGVPKIGHNINLYSLPMHFGKTITGSHGGEAVPDEDIPRFIRLFRENRLLLREQITDEFDLDGINDAIKGLRSGDVTGRCLVRFPAAE